MVLRLNGLTETEDYKAFKFMGGEIHFIFKKTPIHIGNIHIKTRINSSDDLILLILAVDTIKKDYPEYKIYVHIPYMPYQQADRNFGIGESFSLKTITRILNSLDVYKYTIFDPHSDVSPGLLKNCETIDNSEFITWVTTQISSDTIWLSPDAGAYKKIGKLANKIKWKGEVAAANKYRNTSSGEIESLELSKTDFNGKDVLIIDDICMGGNTFIGLAKKLKKCNVGKLYLAISHMIPEKPNWNLGEEFEIIFTTNSRYEANDYYPSVELKVFNII